MMELDNNRGLIDKISLGDYYNSSAFYGFFYVKDEFSASRVVALIQAALKYLSQDLGDFELYSNLVIDEDMDELTKDYELNDQQIDEYFRPLIDLKVLSPIGLASEYNGSILCVSKEVSLRLLDKIFHVVMVFGGASGNVFLLNSAKGIAIYPHDDGGFGVFFQGDRASINAAEEFLNFFSGPYTTIEKKHK